MENADHLVPLLGYGENLNNLPPLQKDEKEIGEKGDKCPKGRKKNASSNIIGRQF
jgi:hypothetical protein